MLKHHPPNEIRNLVYDITQYWNQAPFKSKQGSSANREPPSPNEKLFLTIASAPPSLICRYISFCRQPRSYPRLWHNAWYDTNVFSRAIGQLGKETEALAWPLSKDGGELDGTTSSRMPNEPANATALFIKRRQWSRTFTSKGLSMRVRRGSTTVALDSGFCLSLSL